MRAAELVGQYERLLEELQTNGYDPIIDVERQVLNTITKIYYMQLDYEKAKATHGIYVKFFEDDVTLDEEDVKDVRKARSLNKEIGKRLQAVKQK